MNSAIHTSAGGSPPSRGADDQTKTPAERDSDKREKSNPPDSIPDPLPGVDPQQTPGTDHPPAESDQ